ncbi:pyroglutamyl-peptidase 1-like protein isoform 3 [Homo sapiens]|nr:pyroglutamyl-peptidase 1-like protein isoform 3 [Homo sapiens]
MDTAAKAIILEQSGKNQGYRDADIRSFWPEGGVCLPGSPDVLESGVCMKAVCKRVAVEGVDVIFSRDAGRYVCDYTYYLSLHHGKGCAALIHVPPLSRGLPASLLGRALRGHHPANAGRGGKAQAQSPVRRKLNHGPSSQRELTGGLLL